MERTESRVVQVAPAAENSKIQEMQIFHWSVQGRQEVHEVGDSEGGPDLIGDGYTIKTQVNMYVKLHFVRSLEDPMLPHIRRLEAEYDALPRPNYPTLVPGGFPLIVFWLLPWLTLYIPFGFIRKKAAADAASAALLEKWHACKAELEQLEQREMAGAAG